MGANREALQRYSLAVVSHLLLVAAWHFFVVVGKVPSFVLPSPQATINALLVPNYRWFENIAVTGIEIFGGYILAVAIGITNFGTLPTTTKKCQAATSSRWLITASE